MSGKKFLELLESRGQLDESVLHELRKQLAESRQRVSAEVIAKALVERGLLTKFLATKLVGEALDSDDDLLGSKGASTSVSKTHDPPKAGQSATDNDDLELVPLEGDPPQSSPASTKGLIPVAGDDEDEMNMLEDAGGLTPVEDAGAALTMIGRQPPLVPLSPEPLDLFGSGGLSPIDPLGGMPPVQSRPYVPRKKRQTWDTKLVLGGVTALLLMLLVGTVMVWSMMAVPAREMFDAAEKAYFAEAYSDARQKYEMFLNKYAGDENASKARVRVDLIRLRQELSDPELALSAANQVLPRITAEKDAELGREEFAGLLPRIPEGFLLRARQATETGTREELLAKAKESLALVNDAQYIPTSRRTAILPQIQRINEEIGLLDRTVIEDKELKAAIAEIGEAEQGGNTAKAFERYHRLIREYPRVRDDEGLRSAVTRISARERLLVRVIDTPIAPLGAETRLSEFRVVLANRTGGGASSPQNPVMTVLASGSVYALDAFGGGLLWSRFIGYGAKSQPVRTSAQPVADVLMVDAARQELCRLKARSGELIWRLPIGEPCCEPVVSGKRIYVATSAGRLLEIDADTGESRRHLVIPQRLSVPPAVAADQPYLFQLGDHSNLYVINTESLGCEDVIYLGHKAGTIEVPPLLLMGHLFAAENFRADGARIHVLKTREQGEDAKVFSTQSPIATSGRVVVPLVAFGRRLLYLTDRGEIRVFDVDRTKTENSVTDTGRVPPSLQEPMVGYLLVEGSSFWVADNKFTKYTVQVTRKEITSDPAITSVGDTFVAPPKAFGNHLIHVRRIDGSTGVAVACVEMDNPRKVVWQQQLGVPAGSIAVNSSTNEIVAISSAASLFQIDRQVLSRGFTESPLLNAGGATSLSFTKPIEADRGAMAFFNPAENQQLLVYDPAAGAARLRIVTLPIGDARIPCVPILFQGGLLVPSDRGVCQLFRLSDGKEQLLPFQPKLEPGRRMQWRRPVVIEPDGLEFVIADDRHQIYRVGIKDSPSRHLAELASTRLDFELASGLAAVGNTLFGVVRAAGGDVVVSISAVDLKVVKEWDLQGKRITWGPEREGDFVMVVTDESELHCFGVGETERWTKPAPMLGQPAGRPLVIGNDYLFASVRGSVWRISGSTGELLAKADVGEPLGSGPVAFGGRVLLCGNDGSLHVIPMPAASAGAGG